MQTRTFAYNSLSRLTSAANPESGMINYLYDNNVSVVTEYDALGRPLKVRSAYGTALESWVQTTYDDINRRVIVKADLETIGDAKKVSTQFFDQLGRVRLSKTLENAATQSATNETDGIKVQTRYKTVSGYTYQLSSNPYRGNYAASEADPTMGWTRSKVINTGRHSEVETFSGANLPAPWGNNTTSTGIVQTDIDTYATTVTDQAGKQRRSITNALGQLVRVDEPNDAGQLGSVAAPNQPTSYSYNTLGKMVRVQQGVQNRYFMYDSLGRMLRVKQPEQEVNTALITTGNPDNNNWSAGFTYDNNGNILTTTDAKGTTTTMTYDALNRPLTRSYSNEPQGVSTPAVTNYYDGLGLPSVPQFSKGKLTRVTSSISDSRYIEFDQIGRLKQYQQITDGNTYTSSYQYNLSGALTQETYPSGRVVKNEFETDGDLAKVTSQKAGATVFAPYASNISYSAVGAVTSMRLGNGRFETTQFNSRMQPVQLGLGASMADTGLWKVNYEYGELQTNGTVDSLKNNGNIAKQTLTVPGTNFVQAYKYDPLNRLTETKETTGTTQNWIQNWTYDLYGNRQTFTQNIAGNTSAPNPTIDMNTNRFVTGQGFVYDKNGNVINDVDAATAQSRTFTFNGDNKQTEVIRNGVTIGRYYYDGEGKRIKKVTDAETTVFVYSAGKLVAEYSTQLSSTPSINYTTTDHLGSPRVITDQLAQVKSRRDFMPFGEDIYVNVGARTTALKYGSSQDDVKQKFTGYLKDSETSLDFAEARMYENRFGRFTAIDPVVTFDLNLTPQLWNKYSYALNNPLVIIDITGEFPYTFYVRSFAPPGSFSGSGFHDDGRGFSTDTSSNTTSRIQQEITIDPTAQTWGNHRVTSSPTIWNNVVQSSETPIGRVTESEFQAKGNVSAVGVSTEYSGQNAITKQTPVVGNQLTPAIDVQSSITIAENSKTGQLAVSLNITGDRFPATEAFVADQKGNKVFIVGANAYGSAVKDLNGNPKLSVATASLTISTDKKGTFTGVTYQGKSYSVDDWNKKALASPVQVEPRKDARCNCLQ